MTKREALVEKRDHLVFAINRYDLERNRNEKAHQQRQAELKEKLFANVDSLGAVEREIHLLDLVEFCNKPNLFAPIV